MASGVPTVYPIDLYTFMGFISIKEKGPRGGICRPRGLRPLEERVHNDAPRQLRVQPLP